MNDSGTSGSICAETEPLHTLDLSMEDTRRKLIARREAAGADSADGYTCSNLVEQLENMRGYVRPDWASDVRQTLPWLIQQQMKRLAPRAV